MEFDEYEEKKAGDAASLLHGPGGPGVAPWLEIAASRGRKHDQLEGAVIGDRGEDFGGKGTGRAEEAQRSSPAVPVQTPTRANFVLSPHDLEYFDCESGRHRRYSARNRTIAAYFYRLGGMRWNRCFSESSNSGRMSGCAIEASSSARRRIGWPRRSTTPYSVAT